MAEVVKCNPAMQALVEKGLNFGKDYQKVIDAVFNYWVSPACNDPRIQSWADFSGADRQAMADVMHDQGGGKTVGREPFNVSLIGFSLVLERAQQALLGGRCY